MMTSNSHPFNSQTRMSPFFFSFPAVGPTVCMVKGWTKHYYLYPMGKGKTGIVSVGHILPEQSKGKTVNIRDSLIM